MTDLSPAAQAIWEAFNEDEAGVFVDYGDKLAAALESLADQVVPEELTEYKSFTNEAIRLNQMGTRSKILAIAAELRQ